MRCGVRRRCIGMRRGAAGACIPVGPIAIRVLIKLPMRQDWSEGRLGPWCIWRRLLDVYACTSAGFGRSNVCASLGENL
jgi:hypothetical protein